MHRFFSRLRRRWRVWRRLSRKRRGWRHCPRCHGFHKLSFEKIVVLFEDEPPLFGKWKCPNCGLESHMFPTVLTDDAVKVLGYANFDDYMEQSGLLK